MAKVIGGFKCPYTGKIYRVGEEYSGKYLEEMQEKGYIEKSPKTKAKSGKETSEGKNVRVRR